MFDKLVSDVIGSRIFTIRDAYRIQNKLELARNYCLKISSKGLPHQIASFTILPLLVFIEQEDTDLFRDITTGNNLDALYEYGKRYPTFIRNTYEGVKRLRRHSEPVDDTDGIEASCREYMHNLCLAIYRLEEGDADYYRIQESIGNSSFSSFDKRMYCQLRFT